MRSGFSRKLCPSVQDSWQCSTFEGQICSLRGAFTKYFSCIKMALAPIGFVGCFVTLGLFFFDARALQLRANLAVIGKRIEDSLDAPGQFSNRPHSGLHIFNDIAGAILVYFAVMAGWIYFGLAFTWPQGALPTASAILGIGVVFVMLIGFGARNKKIRAKVIGLVEPEQAPYVAIQSIKNTSTSGSMDEIVLQVKNGVIPIFTKSPKFITYYTLKVKDREGEGYIISAFESQVAAEEATKKAADSVKKNLSDVRLHLFAIGQDFVHHAK